MTTQPEFKPPVFALRPAPIASCPDCDADVTDEGDVFWCPGCRKHLMPADVGWFEGDPYDDD